MSGLHRTARALIEAGKRGETPLGDGTRARVRRSVLRRAGLLGAVAATGASASLTAKAGSVAASAIGLVVSAAAVGAIAGAALLLTRAEAPRRVAEPLRDPHAPSSAPYFRHGAVPSPVDPVVDAAAPTASSRLLPTPTATPRAASALPVRRPREVAAPSPSVGAKGPAAAVDHDQALARSEPSAAEAAPGVPDTTVGGSPRITPPDDGDLAASLALLHEVRAALRDGQSARAIALLDASSVVFAGPLAEQAQAARVAALCQSGRSPEARAATERFLAQWPSSPLAKPLRGGCSSLGASGTHRPN